MSNDAARHDLADALALAQEQMRALASLQQKRAQLTARASVADDTVEITVNAQGAVVRTVIDEAYLDDHDFADLGQYVTDAAQAAIRDVGRQTAEMMAPITERRRQMPSLSDIAPGAPDLRDLIPGFAPSPSTTDQTPPEGDDWGSDSAYPSVRS